MPPDPLHTLGRLRQAELDQASRAVAEALGLEAQAESARRAAEQAIEQETAIATRSAVDADVERFAAWLPRAHARLGAAEQVLEDAAALTAVRRAELSLARAAAEATQKTLEQRRTAERLREHRLQQRDLDDVVPRRPRD